MEVRIQAWYRCAVKLIISVWVCGCVGVHAWLYMLVNCVVLECRAKHTVEDMCQDQWTWARNNPWGYASGPDDEQLVLEDENRRLSADPRGVLNEVSLANGQEASRCFCMKRKVSLVSLSSCSSCDDLTLENEGREAQIIQ